MILGKNTLIPQKIVEVFQQSFGLATKTSKTPEQFKNALQAAIGEMIKGSLGITFATEKELNMFNQLSFDNMQQRGVMLRHKYEVFFDFKSHEEMSIFMNKDKIGQNSYDDELDITRDQKRINAQLASHFKKYSLLHRLQKDQVQNFYNDLIEYSIKAFQDNTFKLSFTTKELVTFVDKLHDPQFIWFATYDGRSLSGVVTSDNKIYAHNTKVSNLIDNAIDLFKQKGAKEMNQSLSKRLCKSIMIAVIEVLIAGAAVAAASSAAVTLPVGVATAAAIFGGTTFIGVLAGNEFASGALSSSHFKQRNLNKNFPKTISELQTALTELKSFKNPGKNAPVEPNTNAGKEIAR